MVVCLAACGRIDFDPLDKLTYREAVLEDRPIGYWRLGDGGALAHDEISGDDGQYVGTCTPTPGLLTDDPDGARDFDGATCCLALASSFQFLGNAPFSVELWTLARTISGTDSYFMTETRASGPTDGYAVVRAVNGIYVERAHGGTNVLSVHRQVVTGELVHVVAAYDGAMLLLYVDGELFTMTADSSAQVATAAPSMIGCYPNGPSNILNGTLDEVAVYDAVLPPERIRLHHEIGTIGPR